jgi:large repetitive protein
MKTLKRFALIATLAVLCCGISTAPGSAASFDDTTPCPASGPFLVCPKGQVGQSYTLQLRALYGCDLFWWEFTNGGLPPGLSMNTSGLITGVPTATGETEPWVRVHDLLPEQGGNSWCAGDNKSERQFVFEVLPGLSIQQQSVPGAETGQPYSQQLTALSVTSLNPVQGSPAQAAWSIESGSLPAGVTFSSSGLLSGTPTTEGSYTFVVKATGGGGTSDTETETLAVRQPITLTSQLSAVTKAEIGIPFTATQSAAGGAGTFTWSVSKGELPAGLTLGADGSISGAPEVAGRFAFTVTATDAEARAKSLNVTLVVAKKLSLKSIKLKAAKAGVPYRTKLASVGGVAPLTWSIRGKLPKGMKLGKTGLLLGTPKPAKTGSPPTSKAQTYRFTATATDALGASAKATLTLVVK